MTETLKDEIAEAAGFHNDTAVVSSRRCDAEYKYMGQRHDVSGTNYRIEPPCDLIPVLQLIRDRDNTILLECTTDEDGGTHLFVPDSDPMDRLFS